MLRLRKNEGGAESLYPLQLAGDMETFSGAP